MTLTWERLLNAQTCVAEKESTSLNNAQFHTQWDFAVFSRPHVHGAKAYERRGPNPCLPVLSTCAVHFCLRRRVALDVVPCDPHVDRHQSVLLSGCHRREFQRSWGMSLQAWAAAIVQVLGPFQSILCKTGNIRAIAKMFAVTMTPVSHLPQ